MKDSLTTQAYTMTGLWKLKPFLLCHLIVIGLIGSWNIPFTRALWDSLDHQIFLFFNQCLQSSPFWQTFWAIANHKYADWVFDGFILYFISTYILFSPHHLKWRRAFEVLYAILVTLFTITCINRYLFTDLIILHRNSPSIVSPMIAILRNAVPWIQIKTTARNSFPADHATTATLFILTMNILLSGKKRLFATLTGLFFILPRLIAGAHWVTDVLIGSLPIALCVIAWTFCTPLYHKFVSTCERLVKKRA